jgi:hypothetical protein
MFLEPYICITFFFISLGLVSLVSFSKRMESPDSVLFNFIQIPNIPPDGTDCMVCAGTLEKVLSRKSAITGRVMICKTLFLKATLVAKQSHHLTKTLFPYFKYPNCNIRWLVQNAALQ